MGGEILVVAVGEVEAAVLAHLGAALTEAFGRPCQVRDALPVPGNAFNPQRRQYSAHAIVQELRAEEADRVLGVVDLDLYVPELNFVFGLADRAGKRAVIALPRLRESFYGGHDDEALFLKRTVKEAVHELGHTCGLAHCRDPRCVMAFSNSLADTDYKGRSFCSQCERRLKL